MQRTFTADLLSNQPPYNTRELGAAVVYADASETSQRSPSPNHGTDATFQQGYNQAYYMENVLPTARGYTSVGFQSTVPQLSSFVPEHVLECRGEGGELTYIAVQANSVFEWVGEAGWALIPGIAVAEDFIPQTAVVRGASYFYFGSYILYKYDFVASQLIAQTVVGVDLGAISGITSGGSQLVLLSSDTVYYSNVLNAIDFLPALSTGAGSTGILALKGTIVAGLSLGQDFIIYTQYSAVHARYTGNLTFPFVFNEIQGSSGVISRNHIAYNTNTGSHIVYTNAGIQEITAAGANAIFPEIADGIAKGTLPYIDGPTQQLDYQLVEALNVRMAFVANRYLFISIGIDPSITQYIKAHVYDTALRRWGSINVTHTCIFEWAGTAAAEGIKTYQDLSDAYTFYQDTGTLLYRDLGNLAAQYSALNKQKIAIMSDQGQVCILAVTENGQGVGDNIGTDAAMPRVFIGRIKMFRNEGAVLQWLRLNKLVQGTIVLHGHDYNGAAVKLVNDVKKSVRHAGTYTQRLNADSVSVEVQGAFVLTELVVCASSGGTHQQYAPAVKKFDRLLLSSLYPVIGDSDKLNSMFAQFSEGRYDPDALDPIVAPIPLLLDGILRDILQLVDFRSDSLVVAALPSFGTGLLASLLITQDAVSDSLTAQFIPVFSAGTLTVVVITHDQIASDSLVAISPIPSLTTGTLA